MSADLALAHGVVRVVAHQGGHVEVDREAGHAPPDEELEPLVGVLAGAEAGDLPHGPVAAAVHGRIGAAGEGEAAGQSDVLFRDVLDVDARVRALDRKPAGGEELVLLLLLLGDERLDLFLLPVADLGLQIRGLEFLDHGATSLKDPSSNCSPAE